jgi:hypothetical protein
VSDDRGAEEEVPKLPRGRGIKLSRPQLVRVVGMAALLVFIVVMQQPCADSMSRFVTGFGDGSATVLPRPGTLDVPAGSGSDVEIEYEHLKPGMTDDEVKAVIERARARASGSAQTPAAAGSGEK